MSNDIPRSWHKHFERKGIPVSYRGLAARAGVSHEAVRRVICGWSVKHSTLRQVADALGVDIEVVQELRGDDAGKGTPWEPPASSSLLSHEEREALSRLISLMTIRRQGRGQHRDPTSPIGAEVTFDAPEQGSTRQRAASRPRPPRPADPGQN